MHQPAWSLFDTIKLAGIDPTRDGYRIDPHLPMQHVLAAAAARRASPCEPGELRGYVRPERDAHADDARARARRRGRARRRARTWAAGASPHRVDDGFVRFTLPATRRAAPPTGR